MSEIYQLSETITSNALKSLGLTLKYKVVLTMPSRTYSEQFKLAVTVQRWLNDHADGKHHSQVPDYYFTDEDIAMQFYLTFG